MGEFSDFLNQTRSNYDDVIMAGDFNLPNINWNSDLQFIGGNEGEFVEILNDYFHTQISTVATRGNNLLDLVITRTPDQVSIHDVI